MGKLFKRKVLPSCELSAKYVSFSIPQCHMFAFILLKITKDAALYSIDRPFLGTLYKYALTSQNNKPA